MYEGKSVRLRCLLPDDAEKLAIWKNDRETSRLLFGGGAMPTSAEDEREWITQNKWTFFAVDSIPDGETIGICGFFDLNEQSGACMVKWLIGDPDNRGKGYGRDMVLTLLDYLFMERNLHRVAAEVNAYNERAVRLCENIGFVREATYREHVCSMGSYNDVHVYSMLRSEYEARYRNA